jgi:putative membrane protein
MMWWNDSGWAWFSMSAMMVAFWTLVVVAIVWVTRTLRSPQARDWPTAPPPRTPQDILAERYARGDIDSDEYRCRLDDIEAHLGH